MVEQQKGDFELQVALLMGVVADRGHFAWSIQVIDGPPSRLVFGMANGSVIQCELHVKSHETRGNKLWGALGSNFMREHFMYPIGSSRFGERGVAPQARNAPQVAIQARRDSNQTKGEKCASFPTVKSMHFLQLFCTASL